MPRGPLRRARPHRRALRPRRHKFDLPSGKRQANFEHTVTVTTTETYDCSTDTVTKEGPDYSGPALTLNANFSYTSSTQTSVEGFCGTGTSERRRRRRGANRPVNPAPSATEVFTTVKTYRLRAAYSPVSGSSTVTLGVSRSKYDLMSGFPSSGSYRIAVTVP